MSELKLFLKENKRWWLTPIATVFVVFVILFFLSGGGIPILDLYAFF